MTMVSAFESYAEALEKMLGDLASAEMLELVAASHEQLAALCAGRGRLELADSWLAAARALRARAAKLP